MDKQELELKENTRAILEDKARRKSTITYKQLAVKLGREFVHPDPEGDTVLGNISRENYQVGKGMLSVVVVSDEFNKPGGGFFKLAREIGALPDNMDDDEFFIQQLNKVYDEHGKG